MATLTNPNQNQGVLNRLRASLTWTSFPSLNVTAPFLGRAGISITFEGQSTIYIDTMTGAVTSPDPYVKVSVEIELLKTQSLGAAYEAQRQSQTVLGECTVRPDTSVLPPYIFENCSLQNVRQLRMNGEDAGYGVTVGGVFYINNSLWNLQ